MQDRFYPIISSLSFCIQLPEADGNNFELKPQFINSLLKYRGLESEDAYFFIKEFEKVCVMLMMQQLGDDAFKLHFVTFALKDLAKK